MAHRWPFTLRLGPDATSDSPIEVEFVYVASSASVPTRRRVRLERVQPRWLAASAAAGIVGLVLLSVAAGTVGFAPPPAPTPPPGQPTPTPAAPALRVGNLVIQPPDARSHAPRAEPTESTVAVAGAAVTSEVEPLAVDHDGGDGFRLPLLFQPLPPRRPTSIPRTTAPPTRLPDAPVVSGPDEDAPRVLPIASPAAEPLNGRTSGPRRGSALEDALRTASIANDEFNRGLHAPMPGESQP
jgi:hypothetical protein